MALYFEVLKVGVVFKFGLLRLFITSSAPELFNDLAPSGERKAGGFQLIHGEEMQFTMSVNSVQSSGTLIIHTGRRPCTVWVRISQIQMITASHGNKKYKVRYLSLTTNQVHQPASRSLLQ